MQKNRDMSRINIGALDEFHEFLRRKTFDVDAYEEIIINPCIPVEIWKQIPEHAIQILEDAGYTKYDRKTDSIVFVQK